MSVDLNLVIADIRKPGATLMFVDDTDFHGDQGQGLATDLRVLAAIKLDSTHYAAIERAMRERLTQLGQREFHVSDIVNPKRGTPWSNVSIPDRIEALNFLSSLIDNAGASMRSAWVSRGQYNELRKALKQQGGNDLGLDRNAALKRFVLRSLLEELHADGGPALLSIDQDRHRSDIELDLSEPAPWLIGGGVLTAPSHALLGLQLADALAYGIGRRFRIRSKFDDGSASDLDFAALGPLAALNGRSRTLFGETV
jgi:hypothetical protein